ILLLVWKSCGRAGRNQLPLGGDLDPAIDGCSIDRAAEQGAQPAFPKSATENARRPEQPPRFRVQGVETGLHHCDHRLWQRIALALGNRTNELFEIKGFAARELEQRRDERRRYVVAEDSTHEPLATLARQERQAHVRRAAVHPELTESGLD